MGIDREKMEKLAPLLDGLNQYRPLLNTFHAESDRGAILVASSILENTLEQLFRSVLVDKVADVAKLFEGGGPLATLSARINMSHAFGLIPEVVARQLHLVRKIRNACAHSPETVTFATREVRDRTEAMWNVDPLVPVELKAAGGAPLVRYKFLINASFLFYQLQRLITAYSGIPRTDLWMLEAAASLRQSKLDEMEKALGAREKELDDKAAVQRDAIDRELERYAREAGITFLEAREQLDRLVEAQEEQEALAAATASGIADDGARQLEE